LVLRSEGMILNTTSSGFSAVLSTATTTLVHYLNLPPAALEAFSTYSRIVTTMDKLTLGLYAFSPALYYAVVLCTLLGPVLATLRWVVYRLFYADAYKVLGKQFVVTGACGALGTNLCIELARRGAHTLVLWDIRDEALATTKNLLETEFPNLRLRVKKVNFLSTQAVRDAANEIMQDDTLDIDVLVNVAGIFFSGTIAQPTDAEEHATIQVNYLAQTHLLKLFIPYMEAKNKGHIVGVASAAAFNAGAGMASYCASKFALRAYYEAVACELVMSRSPVTVSVFCPGAFESKLFQGFEFPLVPAMNATSVARALVNLSIERRFALSIFPRYLVPLPLTSSILAAFGRMLVIPINPLSNWKGLGYARETLGQ